MTVLTTREEQAVRVTAKILLHSGQPITTKERPGRAFGAPMAYAIGEHVWFLHPYYYYLHRLGGWERAEQYSPAAVEPMFFEVGRQRPVLMQERLYWDVKAKYPDRQLARLPLETVLLIMPGPYRVCGLPAETSEQQ